MKNNIKFLIAFFTLVMMGGELQAQYGYGSRGGYGYGRQRSAIPQTQETQKEPEPKTAEQIVDGEMPNIAEALKLDAFETAIMSSVLKKYVQERIEARILELPPDKMREVYMKITERQDADLKAGLPLEKYEAFVKMQTEGVAKTIKNQKKEEKKKRKKKKIKD